jgi:hypothetical protein
MTFFKAIAATALTGLVVLGAGSSASLAVQPQVKEGSPEAHVALVAALQRNGVKVSVNPKICGERDSMGFYSSSRDWLVVCQDNAVPGGPLVEWTENDLDTLRHEAQHFVQDCVAGNAGDNALSPVYRSPTELAQKHLGSNRIAQITKAYRAGGASDLTLLLEYEAFAVAAMNIPLDQISDMKTACGA